MKKPPGCIMLQGFQTNETPGNGGHPDGEQEPYSLPAQSPPAGGVPSEDRGPDGSPSGVPVRPTRRRAPWSGSSSSWGDSGTPECRMSRSEPTRGSSRKSCPADWTGWGSASSSRCPTTAGSRTIGNVAAERSGRGGVLRSRKGLQRHGGVLGLPAPGPPGAVPDEGGWSHAQAGHLRGHRHGPHPHERPRHPRPHRLAVLQCRSCGRAENRGAGSALRGADGRRRPGRQSAPLGAGRPGVPDAPSAPYHRAESRLERRPTQADPGLAAAHVRLLYHEQ